MSSMERQSKFRKRTGAFCMILGALLLLGAAALLYENQREESAAGQEAAAVLEQLQAELKVTQTENALFRENGSSPKSIGDVDAMVHRNLG